MAALGNYIILSITYRGVTNRGKSKDMEYDILVQLNGREPDIAARLHYEDYVNHKRLPGITFFRWTLYTGDMMNERRGQSIHSKTSFFAQGRR